MKRHSPPPRARPLIRMLRFVPSVRSLKRPTRTGIHESRLASTSTPPSTRGNAWGGRLAGTFTRTSCAAGMAATSTRVSILVSNRRFEGLIGQSGGVAIGSAGVALKSRHSATLGLLTPSLGLDWAVRGSGVNRDVRPSPSQRRYVFSVGFRESGFQTVVSRASRPCWSHNSHGRDARATTPCADTDRRHIHFVFVPSMPWFCSQATQRSVQVEQGRLLLRTPNPCPPCA